MELHIFSITCAHCLVLQLLKRSATYWWPPSHLLLAAAIGAVHVPLSARAADAGLAALSFAGLFVLVGHGSQSNHVLLEIAVLSACVLTAPAPRAWWSASHDDWAAARRAWASRLTAAMRALLIALYGVTAFAKLNHDWHDPSSSCAVAMAAAVAGP
jgi:hypothetical protein